jgi:hypothetical protein
MVFPGLCLVAWGIYSRRKRKRRGQIPPPPPPPAPLSPRAVPSKEAAPAAIPWTAHHIIVVGKTDNSTPAYKHLEEILMKRITRNSPVSLAANVELTTMTTLDLPGESRRALEPVIWSLQTRHGRRGGNWNVEFYEQGGFEFMVVYLE